MLSAADHVFQKDNCVVDQEPDRESQRHQRQIVDRESEHVHHREREQQGKRERDGGNERVRCPTEKNVNHHHHQHESNQERRPHIVDGINNCLRSIEYRRERDRSRQTRA